MSGTDTTTGVWLACVLATSALLGAASPCAAQQQAPSGPSLSVRVELDSALADRVEPQDIIYVFARGLAGAGMPLSAVRTQAGTLPTTVVLDDSTGAMSAEKLSDHPEVELVARISKSGDASAQAGDLEGRVGPVRVGPGVSVDLLIDRVIDDQAQSRAAVETPAHPQTHSAATLELTAEVSTGWKSVTLALAGDGATEFEVEVGDSAPLADARGASVEVLSFVPAFKSNDGVVTSASNEPTNPAVLIRITDSGGAQKEGWIFQKYPQFNTYRHDTLDVRLLGATPR
jgi:hypothetical protein